jgi:hypothetical protein
MALVTCAGADALRWRLHIPGRRAWWAWLELDTDTAPSGQVTIAAAGGLSLVGTVQQPTGVFLDAAHVRIVGGAGGLSKTISPAAYENALLGDPLRSILNAVGERLAASSSSAALSVLLRKWTLTATTASRAIDELCFAASSATGQQIGWRVLADGTVWIGSESWPAQDLADDDDVLEQYPSEGRYVIGGTTPSLLPGVDLAGVGKVIAVDHWGTHDRVRADAWV